MDSVPPLDVALALAALRSRTAKELARARGVVALRTEIVGGAARLGACLDVLLRNAFCVLCLGAERSPDAELQRLSAQPSWRISKATAGQLRFVLPQLARERLTHDPIVRAVCAACDDPRSTLRRAIELRNTIVHGEMPNDTAELQRVLAALLAWCEAQS